ncbi:MAG: hypothetical protein NVSMB64_07200 [Candidatus Velthaea sp.]
MDANNEIAVTNAGFYGGGNDSIFVYAAGANGNVAPIKFIGGPRTGLAEPSSIALGFSKMYVTNGGTDCCVNSVTVYSAFGNAAPVATLAGASTGLNHPIAIALDANRNIYVANFDSGRIAVFAPNANGNATPMRTIYVGGARGIALSANGELYVSSGEFIRVYAGGASGSPAPRRTIGGPGTGLNGAAGIALH